MDALWCGTCASMIYQEGNSGETSECSHHDAMKWILSCHDVNLQICECATLGRTQLGSCLLFAELPLVSGVSPVRLRPYTRRPGHRAAARHRPGRRGHPRRGVTGPGPVPRRPALAVVTRRALSRPPLLFYAAVSRVGSTFVTRPSGREVMATRLVGRRRNPR